MRRSYARLPVIALTADAMPTTRQEVLDAGMDGYLLKPIDDRRLHKAIPLRHAVSRSGETRSRHGRS